MGHRNISGGEYTHGIVEEPQGNKPFGRHSYQQRRLGLHGVEALKVIEAVPNLHETGFQHYKISTKLIL
jgi:hypothetical protein